MKKLTVIIFYWIFFSLIVFSQWRQNDFRISIKDNWRDNQPNLESKGELERLFFGDFNAPVEFFREPAQSEPSGLRVVKDSLRMSYALEIKYILSCEWMQKRNDGTIETLSFPISTQFTRKLREKMKTFISTFEEEVTFPDNVVSVCAETDIVIRRFPVGGVTVTFRTVVDDEVWALRIRTPLYRAREFSNLFRQMIEDAKADEFDEEKYLSTLSRIFE